MSPYRAYRVVSSHVTPLLDLLGRVPRPRNLSRVPRPRNLSRVPHFFGEGEREIDGGLLVLQVPQFRNLN